ncbi:ribosomal protein S6 kinase alpha-5, putative [Phytophthora infestans T30-4]|uniref:Ribosomal protein S6 kinase alpha-5, putative n=1 Tax=Phytophthora infestans (strain T30-4) TaxID=403677 RepID=D0RM25_PHYIT|nr:ribosomal protein S6 kinase alpha-5, putative [Phytophthora infestans T30-4]EEY58504.1 ribosomal protein S6 kinase alpha-5, putative [Phytophthora infestans T30-4]|eukprot:XP_002909905.1 ribosomal protein S6 kinase alpha-5, putative [Phytophthora infestans T30-4]
MIAQWCLAYLSSPEGLKALKRMKSREMPLGCVVLSAGRANSDVDLLQTVVSSVYASFKARWSGFRVKNVNSGMEKPKILLVQKKDGADAGHLYAMKVLKKEWVMNKDLVTQTMAERRILQEADHPYIVQLKYAFQNQDKLYMVMEYYSGGSLRQVLRRRGRFSIKRARFYLAEILLAIAHLHASNILYRDLKLENIVITADGNVACTDFGLSKEEMDDNERTSSFVGTCEYLAPELIMKEGYGKAVDWWALGILAYEMIQGDSPFRHNVPTILFDKILKEEPEFSDRFTPEAQDLIMKLLTKDPENRLGCGPDGVEEIKQHPFFAEIDWDKLLQMEMEVPRPPHRMEDVTDESHLSRAIAKMREAREEIMPDSPVSLPSSPSEQKHFDRFSYQGLGDWKPEMADMDFDEETGDFKQGTIHEDEEFVEEDYIEEPGDGDGVPLSPGSKQNSMTSSKTSPSKANGSDTPPASSSAASASPRSPQSVGSPGSPPPVPMSPGSPEGSAPCTPTEPQSQTI